MSDHSATLPEYPVICSDVGTGGAANAMTIRRPPPKDSAVRSCRAPTKQRLPSSTKGSRSATCRSAPGGGPVSRARRARRLLTGEKLSRFRQAVPLAYRRACQVWRARRNELRLCSVTDLSRGTRRPESRTVPVGLLCQHGLVLDQGVGSLSRLEQDIRQDLARGQQRPRSDHVLFRRALALRRRLEDLDGLCGLAVGQRARGPAPAGPGYRSAPPSSRACVPWSRRAAPAAARAPSSPPRCRRCGLRRGRARRR